MGTHMIRMTLAAMNRENARRWADHEPVKRRRLSDPALLAEAIKRIDSELKRGVPVYNQMTFDAALEGAAASKAAFLAQQASKGGKSRRVDPLSDYIDGLLDKRAGVLSEAELRDHLRAQKGLGFIEDIDEEGFSYRTGGKRSKEVAWTALKDRLFRQKAKYRSRKAVRAN
jgi:hypothetical protein